MDERQSDSLGFLGVKVEKIQQEAEGYHVILANSVANAVRMVCTENLPVDLIMVDVGLGAGSDEIEASR